jgi:hypothetical protein
MTESIHEKKSEEMNRIKSARSVVQGTVDAHETNQLVVHQAIEAIGMGRYQWGLLCSCGFGFVVDQVWPYPDSIATCH